MTDERSVLSHYLDDIACVGLFSPEQEVERAREIGRLKQLAWQALLSCPALVEPIVDVVERECEEDRELTSTIRKLRTAARTALRAGGTSRGRLQHLVARAAPTIAFRDVDGQVLDVLAGDLDILHQARGRGLKLKGDFADIDPQELRSYLDRVRRTGHAWRFARNAFVQANLRLVVKIAMRYTNGQLPFEDLIQEGNLGLMVAVERFDPDRGFRFSTYAGWWIRHAITRAIAKKGRTVRIPVYMRTAHARITKERRRLQTELGRAPELDELAQHVGLEVDRIERIEEAIRTRAIGMHTSPIEGGYTLEDTIADERCEIAGRRLDVDLAQGTLDRAMNVLEPMELDILRKRFGLDDSDERTLREVGDDYGLSRERIRQLQNRALEKLRGVLKTAGVTAAP